MTPKFSPEIAAGLIAKMRELNGLYRGACPYELCRDTTDQLEAAMGECEDLRTQLSAMTAARDEACELGEEFIPEDYEPAYSRIAELRKVGAK